MLQTRHFDQIHKQPFGGWGFNFRNSQRHRYELCADLLSKYNVSGSALEVGCSNGFFTTRYLSGIFKDVLAIDISGVAVANAEKCAGHSLTSRIKFRVGDVSNLSAVTTDKFDAVTCLEVLNYWSASDRPKVIKKMKNALKPDGVILVSVHIGKKPYFKKKQSRNLIQSYFTIVDEKFIYSEPFRSYIESPLFGLLIFLNTTGYGNNEIPAPLYKRKLKLLLHALFPKDSRRLMLLTTVIYLILRHAPVSMISNILSKIAPETSLGTHIILARTVS